MRYDRTRAESIGTALAELRQDVFLSIDHADPGWPVLTEAAKLRPPFGLLLGMALGLSDYQPGPGGSERFGVDALLELRRGPTVSGLSTLRDYMSRVLAHTSAARFNNTKRARVKRLLDSDMPGWLGTRSIREMGNCPMELWKRLGHVMNQVPEAKTISQGMKVFDLMHKMETGEYVTFPARVPLLVDLRIARVSLASGLLGAFESSTFEQLMIDAKDIAGSERATILDGWAEVARCARGLSVLRIDGLLWQVATDIHDLRHRPAIAAGRVAAALGEFGASEGSATRLAAELTHALPR